MDKPHSAKAREDLESLILENASKWQVTKAPLAALNDAQLDVIYQISDIIQAEYYASKSEGDVDKQPISKGTSTIDTNQEFIRWLTQVENDIKHENVMEYLQYYQKLSKQAEECKHLFTDVCIFLCYLSTVFTIF